MDVDLHKYDKNPIPDTVREIREEIIRLNNVRRTDKFLSPVEHQLIIDRIAQCEDKIKSMNDVKVKLTPVLRTTSIGDARRSISSKSEYSLTQSKLLL